MPRPQGRRVPPDDDERIDEAAADAADAPAQAADLENSNAAGATLATTTGDAGVSDADVHADVHDDAAETPRDPGQTHDDRSAALLAAGLGLLGIGGAAGLAGSSSSSSPPPAVIAPPTPDHPKSDPSLPDQKPDPGSSTPTGPDQPAPDHPNPDQPKPDQPGPDQPKPDQPKPDQPKPDQPTPDQPKPDQPQQPDPGKTDPTPPTDPDPSPPAHVPATPTLSLASDTGRSDHDFVTSSGAVNVAGLEAGATLAVSLDGGKTWTSRGGDTRLPDALFVADGAQQLQVKQIDAGGNGSAVATLSFVLDRTAPDALHWTMPVDKPALGLGDLITLQGAEPGALVEFQLENHPMSPWLVANDGRIPMSMFHQDSTPYIAVRQTDVAGNVSAVTMLTAKLDLTPPAAPGVVLLNDTGASSTDRITSSGDFLVSGVESDARLLVSLDGGSSWKEIPADARSLDELSQPLNYGSLSLQFKQMDAAGNVGEATALSFTLDREARTPNWTSSNADHRADATTLNGHDTFAVQAGRGFGSSADSLAHRIDGGSWSTVPADGQLPLGWFGADGRHQVELRQTDLAGNVAVRKVDVTLDTTPPVAPTLALFHDDGSSATDRVSTDGRVMISGPGLLGLNFQTRVNGAEGWVDEHLGDDAPRRYGSTGDVGEMALEIRFIDAAGNIGPSSVLHYTLVHSPI